MIGLRKVVSLKIYDLPKKNFKVNKSGETSRKYGYSCITTYYVGNEEVFSRKANSEKTIFPRRFDDNRLVEMIINSAENSGELEKSLNSDQNGFMYFGDQGNKIVYYGDRKEELKEKILARRK